MTQAETQSGDTSSGLKKKAMAKVYDLAQTRNWYLDRYERIVVQRNVLFLLAIVVIVFMGFSVLAVSELNQRKVFEPFVVQVEDKSGIVTQVTSKNFERYTADEFVIRYFVRQYVKARESFNPATYKYDYETVVRLLSSATTYNNFFNGVYESSNPDSPLRLGNDVRREVGIKSLTFLNDEKNQAQVRIVTRDIQISGRNAGNVLKEEHYILTTSYRFLRLDLPQSARFVNPLGFQIGSYVKEEESVK